MDEQIREKIRLCERALNPDWDEAIQRTSSGLGKAERAYVMAHRPGLVKALWAHFAATRDKCGCVSESHERPDCEVRLIERLLMEDELA